MQVHVSTQVSESAGEFSYLKSWKDSTLIELIKVVVPKFQEQSSPTELIFLNISFC